MRSITTIGPRDVIHCRSLSEFNHIADLMSNANMDHPEAGEWNKNTHQTCIQPNGAIGYLGYFVRQAYNIIPASEYLKPVELKTHVGVTLIPVEDLFIRERYPHLPSKVNKKPSWFDDLIRPLVSFLRGKKPKEGPV